MGDRIQQRRSRQRRTFRCGSQPGQHSFLRHASRRIVEERELCGELVKSHQLSGQHHRQRRRNCVCGIHQSSGTPGSATPVIWVGVSQGGTNLFRSTDGGSTWTGINTNGVPSGYMPHHASQDGLGNMYITFCDAPGPNGVNVGVVRNSISPRWLPPMSRRWPSGRNRAVLAAVTVDAENPNTVAVSTIDCWWPQNYVYRSTNGGTNWTRPTAGPRIVRARHGWGTED